MNMFILIPSFVVAGFLWGFLGEAGRDLYRWYRKE